MHDLNTISALNDRASQQCDDCKKFHCEYPGNERFVAKYVVSGFATFPAGTTLHKKLCATCVGGHVQRGYTVVLAL
jgi:hypothetical protein